MLRPFNGSIFQLKGTFARVFPDLVEESNDNKEKQGERFYKIKYTLNMLPSVTYKNGESIMFNDFMEVMCSTEELDIFRTKVVEDFFEHQWNNYAKHLHYFGALIHLIYIILFSAYTI
jgi:hypothetical protein